MSSNKKLHDLLEEAIKLKASDIHLRTGGKPMIRVSDELKPLDESVITPADMKNFTHELFNDTIRETYEKRHEIDFSYTFEKAARFRINAFKQRGITTLAMRIVPTKIKGIKELGLPECLEKISMNKTGLILVTGPTGSGKSTTLTAMIDHINRNSSRHIVTIEDPIEYLHNDIKSIISQRELGLDTFSYSEALRHVVRQDPDVIFVGEMRDMETAVMALTSAQTGHLVLSTIHTVDAVQTITRILDIFSPHHQNQIRLQLAESICAVISQRLLPRKDKQGMVPAAEVLIATSLVRDLIKKNECSSIPKQMEDGDYYGMQTFTQALEKLCRDDKVNVEDATEVATHPKDFMLRMRGMRSGTKASDL
jgi:twitching motility protein PilT